MNFISHVTIGENTNRGEPPAFNPSLCDLTPTLSKREGAKTLSSKRFQQILVFSTG